MYLKKINLLYLIVFTLVCNPVTGFTKDKAYLLDSSTYSALTEIHKDMNEGNNAVALNKLKKLASSDKLKDYDAAVIYQTMGYAENSLNNFKNALNSFIKALSYNALPEEITHQLRFSTAQLLIHLDKPKEGLKYLSKWFANEKSPKADAHILAATAYYYLENYKQLTVHAEKAIAMTSKPPLNWYELLLAAYFETKTYKKAAPLLEKIISKNPNKTNYWLQLAGTYQLLKQEKKALAVYELAYIEKLLEKDDIIRMVKNQLYFDMPYKAATVLEKEMAIGDIEANIKMLTLLADAWIMAKENSKAESALIEIVKKFNDDKTRLRLGQLYIEAEKWEQVINTLDVKFETDDIELTSRVNLLLGIAQYHSNNITKATRAFTLALSNKTTEDQAKWWLEHLRNKTITEKQT